VARERGSAVRECHALESYQRKATSDRLGDPMAQATRAQHPKPTRRPRRPNFSSGPCVKRPGWSPDVLKGALIGRSHRSAAGRSRIAEVLERSRGLLGLPDDYRIALVPGSDTGAFEMAMWSLLGQRAVDVLAWESFGSGWVTDLVTQLGIPDTRVLKADYGQLPDLAEVDCGRDVVFPWNGTTSGVCVPDGDWIAADRAGLTLCDATSAVFAMELPWEKLDAVTWSWQKVLGGEAAHGMLALSPRAVERLESHTPPWPVPKVFRLTKGQRLNEALFRGDTINTPSLLCVEDAVDGLRWLEGIGGLAASIEKARANLAAVAGWVEKTYWIDFLAANAAIRSRTSICLEIVDPWFAALGAEDTSRFASRLGALLEDENAALDIGSYRDAPTGLRLWGGVTVETSDLEAVFPWLDWAYAELAGG